ncbi:tetratricopeptide repeat protein [candidate division WOR-3 bacterium]|nr:tetratricopeptide repeat protein [candidate division WOR-3 bacterium]
MKKNIVFIFILIIVPIILYFQTLKFGYVNWDDSYLLVDNASFFEKPSNIFASFTKDLSLSTNDQNKIFYRPLMLVSYVIEYQWAKENPRSYHLTNVIFHIVSTLLLFFFLRQLKVSERSSFFLSLIFSVHPLTVQSVAWIQGRNDSLLLIFLLLSLISLEKLRKKFSWLILTSHFLAFSAALLTKESALLFPAVYLAYLALVQKEKIFTKRNALLSAGWLAITTLWFFFRSMVIHLGFRGFYSVKDMALGILSYSGKLVFPFDLSPYPVPENVFPIYGVLVLSFIVLLVTFRKIRDKSKFYFGALWFLSLIGVTFARGFTTASFIETRIYPALPGVMLMMAEIDLGKILSKYKYVFFLFLFVLFSSVTYVYSKVYRDPLSHQIFAVKSSPNSWVTRHNLALEYLRIGRTDFAYNQIKRAYSLNPQNSTLNANYALILEKMEMTDSALFYYKKALSINPQNLNAFNNTGLIYYNNGEYDSAQRYFSDGLLIYCGDAIMHFNLANTFFMKKEFGSAKTEYLTVIELDPTNKEALKYLSYTYKELGSNDSAEYYEKLFNESYP